jgi:hypothetical protein
MNHRPDPHDPAAPTPRDAPWLDAARRALDEDAASFDAATVSRLNRARQAALDAARAPRRARWLLPSAFAAAACGALALAIVPRLQAPAEMPPVASASGADFELLATGEELTLYEDLEFYAWLDSQQPAEG